MWLFFAFLSFLAFLFFLSFFCSFLSFLMHTSGGRKAVPWGLHIDERDVRRIDRETATDSDRDQRGTFSKQNVRPLQKKTKKSNFESTVLSCPFLSYFPLKLFNSHPHTSLPTNPQQFIPYYHIHQSQSHTLINHISPRQPLFQTRILL